MSEFSAILDVLACVVSEAFEATLDIVCTAFLGASFIAVWRLGEICPGSILDQITGGNALNQLD